MLASYNLSLSLYEISPDDFPQEEIAIDEETYEDAPQRNYSVRNHKNSKTDAISRSHPSVLTLDSSVRKDIDQPFMRVLLQKTTKARIDLSGILVHNK